MSLLGEGLELLDFANNFGKISFNKIWLTISAAAFCSLSDFIFSFWIFRSVFFCFSSLSFSLFHKRKASSWFGFSFVPPVSLPTKQRNDVKLWVTLEKASLRIVLVTLLATKYVFHMACESHLKLTDHGSVHHSTNLIEMTNEMQLCRTIYYSIVP